MHGCRCQGSHLEYEGIAAIRSKNMADSREMALYAELGKITQALRCFSEPRSVDFPETFKAEDREHADRLRCRLHAIEAELDNIELKKV